MAGGIARRRSPRPRRHALRAGRHGALREQPNPMGRRHLRHARPRGHAAREGGGRPAGPRSQARRRAAPAHARARRGNAARPDRWRARRARRGLLGVDPPGRDDLGLLRLYDVLQPRPVVPVLRLAPAMAEGAARAGRRILRAAGSRLCGAVALRAARPGRSRRRPMATSRARAARAGDPVPGGGAHEFSEAPSAIASSSPCGLRSCSASRSAPSRSES